MSRHDADVAIVGGGTAGCAAAVHLRRAGLSVVLLERDRCGAAASGVNFGGVRQQGRHPAEIPLSRRARELWDGLNAFLGEDVEFEATGHLKLARSERDMADLEAYAEMARDRGLPLRLLGANAVRDAHPWLGPIVTGGSLCDSDGQANPRVVGPAFARLARRLGAEIREAAAVTAARRTETGFEVEAGGATITSRILVNCAGMGAARIAAMLGDEVPLEAIMPNMMVSEPLPFMATRSIGVCGGDVYIRQIRRGNVIFGGGRGVGDWTEWRSRPESRATLTAATGSIAVMPALAGTLVIRTWTGIDGRTPDGIPVLGPSPTVPGLVHAFGFSGHGFQLGPVIGLIVAELVTTGATPSPIAPFRADRFAGGRVGDPAFEVRGVSH